MRGLKKFDIWASILDSKKVIKYISIAPAAIILIALSIYPFLFLVYNSLRDFVLTKPKQAAFIGIQNYIAVFRDPIFTHSLLVTALFVLGAVTLEFLIGFGLAIILNKPFRGSGLIRAILLIPMMLTPVVVGLQWKFLLNSSFGLVNYLIRLLGGKGLEWIGSYNQALFSAMLVDAWQWTPFILLLMAAGLRSLPTEPYEASAIDGASALQNFFYLTLPILKPVILLALFFRAIDAFKVFDIIYSMTGGGPSDATMTVTLYDYRIDFEFFKIGYGAAIAITEVIIISLFLTGISRITRSKI